jgi:hypothetical protein
MKTLRIGGAVLFTVILLLIARQLSLVKERNIVLAKGGLEIRHTTVPKVVEGIPDKISLALSNPGNKSISIFLFICSEPKAERGEFTRVEMKAESDGKYAAPIPILAKGAKLYYFIEIADEDNNLIARIPDAHQPPLKIKYEGAVPLYIVIPHILLMFSAIYFASLALFDAIAFLRRGQGLLQMARSLRLATASVFLGGYPFGWGMNHYAFGTIWEGIPFGWDFTDNKTQIVMLYLLFLNLSMLGTLYGGKIGDNHFSDKTLARLTIIGFLLILGIYLIPHSIQFSIPITAIFAYGLTAIIVGLYIWGLSKKIKRSGDR